MKQSDFRTISCFGVPLLRSPRLPSLAWHKLGSFPLASAWPPHEEVLKGNAPIAGGEQGVAPQAMDFALLYIANVNRDDPVFRLARGAAERNGFRFSHCATRKGY